MPKAARQVQMLLASAAGSSGTSTTISHAAARWFSKPQGEPSGVCTGHMKPQESGSNLRTCGQLHEPDRCAREG